MKLIDLEITQSAIVLARPSNLLQLEPEPRVSQSINAYAPISMANQRKQTSITLQLLLALVT